ncbi:hypothetical protein ABHA56_05295 [Blautia wexlerae]|jgi:hypothetical protein|uniref:hypothetical protein n=1 Tax=Blautia wexlerae TaxID=418240 RepID=UPI00290BDC68|nr:hypothetical protein [Ruminococcus sp.]
MSDLMYTPLENVFADTMEREGKSITAVISGKTFIAFFRRCDDGQSTEDRIMLYYGVDAPVDQGSLIQYGRKTYVLVNKETEENTCYYKSFAIACNGILNTNNRTVKNVPVYGYDMKNGLASVNNTISIVNGNMEFVTEITDTVKVLAIDDTFNIYGRTFKVDNIYQKDGLFHIIAEVYANVNPDPEPEPEPEPTPDTPKQSVTISGGDSLRYGRTKSWTVAFTDSTGATIEKTDFKWNVVSEYAITQTVNGTKISLKYTVDRAVDKTFTLQVLDSDGAVLAEQTITFTV